MERGRLARTWVCGCLVHVFLDAAPDADETSALPGYEEKIVLVRNFSQNETCRRTALYPYVAVWCS